MALIWMNVRRYLWSIQGSHQVATRLSLGWQQGSHQGGNRALTRVATGLSLGWQQGSHQGGNRALHSVATGLSSGWQQGFSRVDNRALTMVATGLSPIWQQGSHLGDSGLPPRWYWHFHMLFNLEWVDNSSTEILVLALPHAFQFRMSWQFQYWNI